MIKFISPEPNGGMPFEIEDLLQVQDGVYSGLAFLCSAAGTPLLLSGCEVTTSTATTCTISSGWVWLENDFRLFPGYSGSYPFYIVKDVNKYYTKTFEDGTIQNALVDTFAKAVTSVAANQENIAMNPSNASQRYKTAITSDVTAALATETLARSAADANLQVQVDKLAVDIKNKATKFFTAIPWTDIYLEADGASATTPGLKRAQYMLDELGTVRLRGNITNSTLLIGQNKTSLILATLPASILPAQNMSLNPAVNWSSKHYTDANGNLNQYQVGQTMFADTRLAIAGKESFGNPIGRITILTKYPIFDAIDISLEGISWCLQ